MIVRRFMIFATALVAMVGAVWAQSEFAFMPDGGRNLAVEVFAERPGGLAGVAADERDVEGWRAVLDDQAPDLAEEQALTLASYLALNLPMDDPAALEGLGPEELALALPLDGKDLAIRHCQFCHGFYTAYLGHDRDINGWLVVFNSPFHMEIRMNPVERRTFAHYSAINLPMPISEVPPDFRY